MARCSDVTVTRADGTVEVKPAYKYSELRKIIKQRDPVTPAMRRFILNRDHFSCRYCWTTRGPFQIDHVVPVALGGATTRKNLVTACEPCNQRKGTRVWKPRPINNHGRSNRRGSAEDR